MLRIRDIPENIYYVDYDKWWKLVVTGLHLIPYVAINSIFVVPLFIFGFFLYSLKVIAIGPVEHAWYNLWVGLVKGATKEKVDIVVLKNSIHRELLLQSLPQLLIQLFNNMQSGSWSVFAYVSIILSATNAIHGIYHLQGHHMPMHASPDLNLPEEDIVVPGAEGPDIGKLVELAAASTKGNTSNKYERV
jgi:hypothetical protein